MEDRNYLYQLLERLTFPRFGGTADELRAAELLRDEIAALGGQSELMPFEIPAYEIHHCALTAGGRPMDCVARGHSGQLPEGGVDLPLRYLEGDGEVALRRLGDLAGCAVLANSLGLNLYRELVKRRAAAIIEIDSGKWYGERELVSYEMRPEYLKAGQIPTFTIRPKDAMYLVGEGIETVHLELRQHSFTATSHNLLATVEGTGDTGEEIVLTAHYDSISVSPGAWDNGSGAVTLLYVYRHFLRHPPKRTMRFIWCGSEEQGLLGSKAYVATHEELLPSIRLCFNLDSCGSILGENTVDVAGSEALLELTRQISREADFSDTFYRFVDGSDCAPFADRGIPAVCPARGHWSSIEDHTPWDRIDTISPQKLIEMGDFSIFFLERVVNAEVFPIEREMPQDMVEQLDKMFRRDQPVEA